MVEWSWGFLLMHTSVTFIQRLKENGTALIPSSLPSPKARNTNTRPVRMLYGKNDPFRSWPISANELKEVAMGSETNV